MIQPLPVLIRTKRFKALNGVLEYREYLALFSVETYGSKVSYGNILVLF